MSTTSTEKLGIVQATCYLIGDIIGSGIFVSPTGILLNCGSVGLSLIIWTVCGLLSMLGALCYIELGTSIPYSGGDFAYLCYYQWHPVAFSFLFTYFIIYKPCSVAILGKTFGSYVVQAINPVLNMSDFSQDVTEKLLGICILRETCTMKPSYSYFWVQQDVYFLVLLTWINFYKLTKYAAKIQVVVTIFKVVSLGIIIVTGIVYMSEGNLSNFQNPMQGSIWSTNLVLAISSGLWSYDGWDSLNFGVEELNRPKRTLFFSSFCGVSIVILVYLATNVAYIAVLGKSGMLNSTTVAETFSEEVLGDFSYAVPLIVGIVIMGSLNSSLFTSSRYFYAAARQGHLPRFMKLLHVTQHTPQPSLVTYAVLGVIMINVASVDSLINYATFVVWLQRVFTIAGLMWIRFRKWPVSSNAIKVPFVVHMLFFLCTLLLVAVQTYTAWKVTVVGYGVAIIGLGIYFVLVRPEHLPHVMHNFDEKVMKLCQIIFYSMPEILETENSEHRDTDINDHYSHQNGRSVEKF